MPAISIIIPVYNVEKYLRRCLDSVLNQTFQDWQAICVNDGSPDNSADILDEYAKKDSRFVVVTKENGGSSDARNVGIKKASGDYVMYLDSDDFIHCQTLDLMYGLIKANNADMALFDFDVLFYNTLKTKLDKGDDVSGLVPDSKNKVYVLNQVSAFVTDNALMYCTERNRNFWLKRSSHVRRHCYPVLALYRRDLIQNIPFIKGIIIEDFPWWLSVLYKKPKTVITKLPLYFYIPNKSSQLNSSKSLFMARSIATGLKTTFDLYSRGITKKEFRHLNRHFLWPFTIIMMRKIRDLDNVADKKQAKNFVADLYAHGVFNQTCGCRSRKYKRRIEEFIK